MVKRMVNDGACAAEILRVLVLSGMLAVLLVGSFAVAADQVPVDANGLPLWVVKEWTDFPVLMELPDHDALEQLLATVPIASFNREQFAVHFDSPKSYHLIFKPRVTEAEAAALAAAGYDFTRVRDLDREGRESTEAVWAAQAAKGGEAFTMGEKGTYPTHAQIGSTFAQMTLDNPDLCRDFTIGSSVQGREQWGIVISDDVQNTEAEPEVMLSSSIHGDEVTGMFLLFNFAQYLVDNYGVPGYEDVTNLVDNYEIHIIPDYNPDGTALHQRYNANGTDLNRNFPEPSGPTATEQENLNFMNYVSGKHFVIGENYHGGALVVNYPWDHTYALAPDNDAFIKHSLEYSTYNLPMYNGSFPQGITNGADWYVIDGGLQDWHYFTQGAMAVTIEVSDTKWPAESLLDGFWADNLESLMHWVKAGRYGVNGIVTGSDSGLPVDATVTISGIDTPAVLDPVHGDYYKLLGTGTYDITFEAYGYITQTVYNVSTTWGTPTVLDVVMDPVAHGDVSGTVTDLGGNGLDAAVQIYTVPGAQFVTTVNSSAADGGAYTANLVYGEYELKAVKSGYVTQSQNVTIGEVPQVADFQLSQAQEVVLFSDDFESGLSGWTGDWGLADPAEGYNSPNCLNDSPGGDYADNVTTTMTMVQSVDLTGAMSGELSFRAKWEIENIWDAAFVEVSTNGGAQWTALATQFTQPASGQGGQTPAGAPCFDDNQVSWVLNTVNLAPYLGQSDLLVRFRLSSDTSVNYSGFFVDDFQLLVVREQTVTPVPGAAALMAGVRAWPNPFNPQTTVEFTNPRAGQVAVAIYDVQGRRVRQLVSESLAAGDHTRVWDGRTDNGSPAPSGVYFARMTANDAAASAKLMLVK
jgi:hypothetical protein